MAVDQQVAYLRTRAESGPLGEWWSKLPTSSGTKKVLKKAA